MWKTPLSFGPAQGRGRQGVESPGFFPPLFFHLKGGGFLKKRNPLSVRGYKAPWEGAPLLIGDVAPFNLRGDPP